MLKCPVCHDLLSKQDKSYICQNSHCFDMSKTGYVNLLLANQKASKDPGDSKEMINSRYDFLSKDFYRVISDGLNDFVVSNLVKSNFDKSSKLNILDVGCGTGYYLSNLVNKLEESGFNFNCTGLDISKNAVVKASKNDKQNKITWIIGSSYNLPIIDNSQNVLINIFAPYNMKEFSRVLNSDCGEMYFVVPNSNHLGELRDIFFGEENKEKSHDKLKIAISEIEGLEIANSINVKDEISLNSSEDISNLLKMTPYYWKIKKDVRDKVLGMNFIEVGIDVQIYRVVKSC